MAIIRKMETSYIIDKIDAIIRHLEESGSRIVWDCSDMTSDCSQKLVIKGDLKKYVKALGERFCLTEEQALFIPYFVKNCKDHDAFKNLDKYFNVYVAEYFGILESLTESGYLKADDSRIWMSNEVVQYIIKGDNEIKPLSNLKLVEKVVYMTKDKGLPDIDNNPVLRACLRELGTRFNLNLEQALFLAIFIKKWDDLEITYRELAYYFDVRPTCIVQYIDTINSLVSLGYLNRGKTCYDTYAYRMPMTVVHGFMNGIQPMWAAPCKTPQDWMVRVKRIMARVEDEKLNDAELESLLEGIFSQCDQFEIVQKLNSFKLSIVDLKFYLILIVKAVFRGEFNIKKYDLEPYYMECEFLSIGKDINPTHCKLFRLGLIDYVNEEGRCYHDRWCLTDKSKTEVLHDFLCDTELSRDRDLLLYENIQEKPLYYSDDVIRQVEQLRKLLTIDNMNAVLDRLAEKGMRKGFACLFYGGPGTGKTESVLQLARRTGRDVMQVDISNVRDKWVGETEKNIKHIFDKYRNYVKNSEVTPILFFNEADALFNTRNENCSQSVDKMENAMQNIILQELENMEGILIATTNLTQCLDPAFERRFLFKIEFIKPTPNERYHIWHAMLPELSDKEALKLAEQFDFSGGQIENITRKVVIDSILWGKEKLTLDNIQELCSHETLNKDDKGGNTKRLAVRK